MAEKVEILLATYNGEKYIREQLDSIQKQEYDNWIVRACDDASTDHTYEILLEYKEQFPDKFIVEQNKVGFGSAKLNFLNLIKKSSCDYVMCCDQDDVWLPNKISLTMEEMKKYDKSLPVLVHTDLKVVDSKLHVLSESFFQHSNLKKEFQFSEVLIQNHVTGCTMMMNRALVELMKMVEHCDKILMHDWLAALVASANGKVGFVDCPTMLYRQHEVNSVGAKRYGVRLFMDKFFNHDLKRALVDTTVQAEQIAEIYKNEFNGEAYGLLSEYAMIWKKNKLQRISFYIKHKVLKKGLFRQVCQLLIG